MEIKLRSAMLSAAHGCIALSGAQAQGTPEGMIDECRAFVGSVTREAFESVQVKYEGERTDGTHAVNGSVRGLIFQCSFHRDGYYIEQFIVNNPNPG